MNEFVVFLAGCAIGAALVYVLRARAMRDAAPPPTEAIRNGSTFEVDPSSLEVGILDHLSEGILVLNDVLRPVVINRSARVLLHLDDGASALPPDDVMSIARRSLTGAERVEEVIDIWSPERRSISVAAGALADGRGVVLTLRDVSVEQRALRIRRQFVSHASHEMKSPVASIQTLAEAISAAAGDDTQAVEQFSGKLIRETQRLGKLIADLLDLSRIEDPGSFSRAPVDVSAVARREVAEELPAAKEKGLELTADVEEDVWSRGDEQQLSLLVRNLLDNAIRYTPSGGNVRVGVRRTPTHATIEVIDDGIGIPLKAQARVFERFYRVDEGRSREEGGTGLGLAIVKHVADLYGGRVELQSEFGEGSTFTAYLPLGSAPPD